MNQGRLKPAIKAVQRADRLELTPRPERAAAHYDGVKLIPPHADSGSFGAIGSSDVYLESCSTSRVRNWETVRQKELGGVQYENETVCHANLSAVSSRKAREW
jgi:hypothetical protein